MDKLDDKSRAEIVFAGSTLGPLFLHDPEHDAQVVAVGLEALASLDVEAAAKDWPFVSAEDAERALALMHEGLAEGTKSDALVWEYRRLFVGPLAKPAPPWGSVYTDKDMVVFGASTMQLRDWMRRNGIAIEKGESDEPEDHIGTMLVLLSWLAEERPELVDEFLRDHLLTWSSHFLEQLEEAAEQPFYEGLANLTRKSLEGLQEERELKVAYPRFYR